MTKSFQESVGIKKVIFKIVTFSMKRLLIISIFLFSSILFGQSGLRGTWISKNDDHYSVYTIYKTFTGQYVEYEGVAINNNYSESRRLLTALFGTKELYDPWIGDSYTEDEYADKKGEIQTTKSYYKLIDNNTLLVNGHKYQRSSLTVEELKKKYKAFNNN